jgi:hypothetical protein
MAMPESPAPKKKRGRLVGLIVAAVLVVLGVAGVLAYNFWYQNPEKVLTDGLVNAIKAKSVLYTGTLSMTGDQEFKIEVSGKSNTATGDLTAKVTAKVDGKDMTLSGGALVDDKGDLYFKIANVDNFVKEYRETQSPEFQQLIDDLIAKVNDQWIRVNADDLKTFSDAAAAGQTCINDAVKKIQSDESTTTELADTYKKHRFITIEKNLGTQNGSLGYQLTADTTIAKAFVVDFKNTKLYKTLHECDPSIVFDENEMFKTSESTSKEETRTEIWVSQWSHQITKVYSENTTDTNKGIFVIEPKFNEKVDAVKAPEKSTTLKQLQADIEALFQSAMSSAATTETADDAPLYSEL